jgi:hypothetical protein
MARINYVSLSALQPLELQYSFYKNEDFKSRKITHRNGFNFYYFNSLENFQDITVNKGTCFILTSSINLDNTFTNTTEYVFGNLPGSFYFQPRNSLTFYAWRDSKTNTISLKQTEGSIFYLNPIQGTDQVEIFVNGNYLQVEEQYPYKVVTSDISLSQQYKYRQRFVCVYQNQTITFKTLTNSGYRYLAFNSDNTLQATGTVLNNAIIKNNSYINNYLFSCTPVTREKIDAGFSPINTLGTYFADFAQEIDNKTVKINKNIPIKTNLLISFSTKRDNTSNFTIPINIANLKTILTPTGAPPSIVNV